jgi:hypothetical protein
MAQALGMPAEFRPREALPEPAQKDVAWKTTRDRTLLGFPT